MDRNMNYILHVCSQLSIVYRISLTLACPMNLKLYPLDRQICSLRMASCEWWYNSELILIEVNLFCVHSMQMVTKHRIHVYNMATNNIIMKYTREIPKIV
jgi:hypothetical protein